MFSSFLIGQTSLLIQCAEILQQQHFPILGIVSADTAVSQWAQEYSIPCYSLQSDWPSVLKQTPFDYLFSIVNPTIIPDDVLAVPCQMAINYHDSPLPRYAGMYATSWAIINGETEHGISWHEMTAVIDAGDIIEQKTISIGGDDTAFTLNAKCYAAAIGTFDQLTQKLADGTEAKQPQSRDERSYFGLHKRPFPTLTFNQPAQQIGQLVRGLDFGVYDNPLGRPNIQIGQKLHILTHVGVKPEHSGAQAGTVTAVSANTLQIASTTNDIIVTLDEQPNLAVGDKITPIDAGRQLKTVRQLEQVAQYELFWRQRLMDYVPLQLPEIVTIPEGRTVTAVHIAYFARMSGQNSFTIGLLLPQIDSHYFADVVPFHVQLADDWSIEQIETAVQQELQTIRQRGTFTHDLLQRYGDLAMVQFKPELVFEEIRDWRLAKHAKVEHLATLQWAVIADPQLPLCQMPLLTVAEQHQIIVQWNDNQIDFPEGETVVERFLAQVTERPSALAALCDGDEITYLQLQQKAQQVAHHLQKLGIKHGDAVGVYLPRSLDVLGAMWGIWQAGGVYLPLDPEYPEARLAYMVQDAKTAVILTHRPLTQQLPVHQAEVVLIDELDMSEKDLFSLSPILPDDSAYIIYTSGSTGQPKGAVISHRAIAAHIYSIQHLYQINSTDHVLQFSSFNFDTSIEQILTALLHGATLVMRGESVWNIDEVAKKVSELGLTVANFPTAYWHLLVQHWQTAVPQLASLRLLISGGEAMHPVVAEQWLAAPFNHIQLLNAYGPTEASVTAMVYDVTKGQQEASSTQLPNNPVAIPIGRPLPNRTAVILDKYGHPTPIGVPGELHLGGIGLANGYLNQPELTHSQFVDGLYKTGDLAYYLADGTIVFAGRVDEQIKLRGFRIELGEIEAAILRLDRVLETVVVLHHFAPNNQQIIAYVVGEVTETQLHNHLINYLPTYMVPTTILFLDQLPLSPAGKIKRRALPKPQLVRRAQVEFEPVEGVVEKLIEQVWTAVLGIPNISRHDNFFHLGGDSLKATQIGAQLGQQLRMNIPLQTLFVAPTISQLAEKIVNDEPQTGQVEFIAQTPNQSVAQLDRLLEEAGFYFEVTPPIPTRNGRFPKLSFAQQRLWFLDQLVPQNAAYNIPVAIRLRGDLDTAVLHNALNQIVQRHETLRTTFARQNGRPVPIIAPEMGLELPVVDATEWMEIQVEEYLSELVKRPFALTKLPLIHATLLRITPDEHILVLPQHHIISDGMSVDNLLHELEQLYLGHNLPPVPTHYSDYALWEQDELQKAAYQAKLAYWKKQLGDDLPVLQLPHDYPRPSAQTFNGAVLRKEIGDTGNKLSNDSMTQLLVEENATLFMALFTAYAALLHRYTGQNALLIGTPVANRSRPELQNLIGFFVNTVVLRTGFSDEITFRQLLQQVRQTALDAFHRQDIPFEMIVEAINPERDLSHQPLFQTMFSLQEPTQDESWGNVTVERLHIESGKAKFDLNLVVERVGEQLVANWEYSTDLFGAGTIKRLAGHFENLLTAVIASPDKPISQLSLLDQVEHEKIVASWNEPRITTELRCWHRLFEEQAAKTPDAKVVHFETQSLTYAQLNGRANQLAHRLQKMGITVETPVGIYMPRCNEWIVAILAIMKAGGAYVPLDPRFPAERIGHMLYDAKVPIVLVLEQLTLPHLPDGVRMVFVDDVTLTDEPISNPHSEVGLQHLAYVLFTSGSTGRSKGVAVEHRQLMYYVTAVNDRLDLPRHANYAMVTTFAADNAHTMIFPALILDSCLHIISEDRLADPIGLTEYFSEHRIDCLKIVPSHMGALLTAPHPEKLLPKQRLVMGGESSSWQLITLLLKLAPPTLRIFNHYGPTEATVGVCTFEVGQLGAWEIGKKVEEIEGKREKRDGLQSTPHALHAATVPIGRPLPFCQLYILDQHMNPVPAGVTGELYLGGMFVARGYLHRPDLTNGRFVPDIFYPSDGNDARPVNDAPPYLYKTGDLCRFLPDGNVEFLGRIDYQVKIRGFRIELGEIEAVLRKVRSVREVLVMAINGRLIAYIVGDSNEEELQEQILAKLPNYMLPSSFIFLEAFPLLANGKISRSELPEPDLSERDHEFVSPSTETQKALAAIWVDLLMLDQISIYDDFFALGGHSLLATQLISRIQRAFGVALPVRRLFEASTLVALAEAIDKRETAVSDTLLHLPSEITLDAHIKPVSGTINPTPEAILLTGATGFLGAFLLEELLKETSASIHCLVRGEPQRLEQNLRFYGLWQDEWRERIVLIKGDLALPRLGLKQAAFHELAQQIDVVYHNGSWVNFIYPYSVLKPTNVGGTKEILKLATVGRPKAIHYVSTLSVFPNGEKCRYESDELMGWGGLIGGYAQSKWVAERTLMLAKERGFAVSVYRPGRITGHSETAVFNHSDFLYKLIKGCLQIGLAPDLQMTIDMTPVDYVSRAIIYLSRQPQASGKAYHLLSQTPLQWHSLLAWMQSADFELEIVPYETWRLALLVTTPDNALYPFMSIFTEGGFSLGDDMRYDTQQATADLTKSDIHAPLVDNSLLSTYFSHFIDTDFLNSPMSSGKVQNAHYLHS